MEGRRKGVISRGFEVGRASTRRYDARPSGYTSIHPWHAAVVVWVVKRVNRALSRRGEPGRYFERKDFKPDVAGKETPISRGGDDRDIKQSYLHPLSTTKYAETTTEFTRIGNGTGRGILLISPFNSTLLGPLHLSIIFIFISSTHHPLSPSPPRPVVLPPPRSFLSTYTGEGGPSP